VNIESVRKKYDEALDKAGVKEVRKASLSRLGSKELVREKEQKSEQSEVEKLKDEMLEMKVEQAELIESLTAK